MDVHDLHKRKRNTKDKGVYVQWSVPMDKCLLETLAIQGKNGNKFDKGFNENAYTAACNALNSRFDFNLDIQKVKNRLKTIKKNYKLMRDLLRQDGFKWNPISKSIECQSEELWDSQIAACADVRQFRGRQIEMYDELNVVCGNSQASTGCSQLNDESPQPKMKNNDENPASFVSPGSEDQTDTDENNSDSEPEENNSLMPTGNNQDPKRQIPKRPRMSEVLQDVLGAVASSINRLTDSMERRKINPSELLRAVMEIDELDKAKLMEAFEYLSVDTLKARVFLNYDAHKRKTYFFQQYPWLK